MREKPISLTLGVVALLATAGVVADDFTLDWYSIDAGGEMFTTGGEFELSGTIGQPDASTVVMTGGNFELAGGFWPGVPPHPLGDLNCDGQVNNLDIRGFRMALLDQEEYYETYPDCDHMLADINGDDVVNNFDITPFMELLTGR